MGKPKVAALLLCDSVASDPSGKITLYGIFDTIYSNKFPAVHGQVSVYFKCSVSEPGELTLVIEGADGTSVFKSQPAKIERTELARNAQGVYSLIGLTFPHPGTYTVKLLYGSSEEIARTDFTVEPQGAIH